MTEKIEYDNMLNILGSTKKNTLFDETNDELPNDNSWQKHWKGMPSFIQEEKKPYKTLYIHFKNEEDYQTFASLIVQDLTEKTKSIWFPSLERDKNTLKRWIETEDDKS